MSVAVLDSLNLMRASMEEEVVLQSTLAVPAHHAIACRIEAYGTPFTCAPRRAAPAHSCLRPRPAPQRRGRRPPDPPL